MPMPIIAFSKDWHEDPTSNHHVLRELAKTRRVLWLNSLATRTPKLSSTRDLGKVKRKLSESIAGSIRGPVNVEHDLWVATPLVLPLHHRTVARAVNRRILRAVVHSLRRRLDITQFQLWTFLPNTSPYLGTLGEALAVYYCVDEWSTFPGLDRLTTVELEHELLQRVDVTFATSRALYERKGAVCATTYLAPHGVDHALFARALADDVAVPADLAAMPRPRIGFFGTLRDFIDLELLGAIARARPRWSFALIGQQLTDTAPIQGLPNVHLLGQRPHAELPAYCKGFDVGLIPYRLDHDVKFINPLKLREYLSAGVPVVAADMPEVLPYAELCHIATSVDETIAAIEHALGEGGPADRRARSASMVQETWAARVEQLVRIVDGLAACKSFPRPFPMLGDPLVAAW
jgi:glycosyltransferase involved in cell wall biosynthesis